LNCRKSSPSKPSNSPPWIGYAEIATQVDAYAESFNSSVKSRPAERSCSSTIFTLRSKFNGPSPHFVFARENADCRATDCATCPFRCRSKGGRLEINLWFADIFLHLPESISHQHRSEMTARPFIDVHPFMRKYLTSRILSVV